MWAGKGLLGYVDIAIPMVRDNYSLNDFEVVICASVRMHPKLRCPRSTIGAHLSVVYGSLLTRSNDRAGFRGPDGV